MGSISRLAMMCVGCPKVETCNHKRMEALAYFEEPNLAMNYAISAVSNMTMPNMRETMTIFPYGQKITVDKEDFLKNLNSQINSSFSKRFLGGC